MSEPKAITVHQDAVLLRREEVGVLLGLSTASIYRMVADGTFPRPVPIARRTVRWERAAVERWLAERRAAIAETAAPQ